VRGESRSATESRLNIDFDLDTWKDATEAKVGGAQGVLGLAEAEAGLLLVPDSVCLKQIRCRSRRHFYPLMPHLE